MTMTFECASYIVFARSKFAELWNKALDEKDQEAAKDIENKLDRLRPYGRQANEIVWTESEKAFAAEAKKLSSAIKPINDALADFKNINDALKAAASVIDTIFKLLGFASKI